MPDRPWLLRSRTAWWPQAARMRRCPRPNRLGQAVSTAKAAVRARRRPLPRLNRGAIRYRALRGAEVLLAAGFAAGHAALLIWAQYKVMQSGLVNWPVLLAPALVTLAFLPSSRAHWRRWALLYFVVFVCNPVLLPQVLVITETVVLYSIWVRARQPGDLEWVRRAVRGTRPVIRWRSRRTANEDSGPSGQARISPPAKGSHARKRPGRGPG